MSSAAKIGRFFGAGALVVLSAACARQIDMSATASSTAHGTLLYSGVRDASRRFADYGSIDRRILTEDDARP